MEVNQKATSSLPEYSKPPLTEVVVGVQFENITALKAPHLWKLWESIGKDNFPHLEDVPPLARLDDTLQFVFGQSTELPRHWFIHKDNSSLVQLQRDRFLYNWRKLPEDSSSSYPRYDRVIECFYKYFGNFTNTLTELAIPLPVLEMLELTYVNIVPLDYLDNDLGNISGLLRDINWQSKHVLSSPQGINFSWWFDIEELKSKMKINIVSAQQQEDGLPVIRMELSVRGIAPSKQHISECSPWFDGSHERIVRAFDDITAPKAHALWGKK